MAVSLYRKYRPLVFEDVIGQEHVEQTLVNAVHEDNVAHAYLFCGPRGTGKTTTARLLAKALLCQTGKDAKPCGTCEACQEIADGIHPDVYELDAASHTGVENVREEIISRVQFAPTHGRYKVYIIDEVHMLSTAAFNALLKTLEEPPAHVVFVLCTTDPHKVPDTIQSRCQRFDFRRFSIEETVKYLRRICDAENFKADTEALSLIAAKSNGGMRDATTSLEQVAVFTGGDICVDAVQNQVGQNASSHLFDFAQAIALQNTAECFVQVQNMVNSGSDLVQFARDLSKHIRNLYVASIVAGAKGDGAEIPEGILACSKAQAKQYLDQVIQFGGTQRLSHALLVCGDLINELKNSTDARLSVEIACTRLCRPESEISLEALAARVERLEAGGVEVGSSMAAGGGSAAAGGAAGNVVASDVVAGGATSGGSAATGDIAAGGSRENAAEASQKAATTSDAQKATVTETSQKAVAASDTQKAAAASDTQKAAAANSSQDAESAKASSSADTPEMSPARLKAAVLTEIKRDHMSTSALIENTSFEKRGQAYVLVFPQGNEFTLNLAQSPDSYKHISKAFEAVLGFKVEVEFEMQGGPQHGAAKMSASSAVKSSDDSAPKSSSATGLDVSAAASTGNVVAGQAASGSQGVVVQEGDTQEATSQGVAGQETADQGTAAQGAQGDTAAELADMFSAFGDGINFEEV